MWLNYGLISIICYCMKMRSSNLKNLIWVLFLRIYSKLILNTFSVSKSTFVFIYFNRSLDLSNNNISNFNEIVKLGNIETLKCLNVAANGLKRVELPDCRPDEQLKIFVNLNEIILKDNPIEDKVSTIYCCSILQNQIILWTFHISSFVHIPYWQFSP